MQVNKEIIVVAPEQYKDFARELTHNVSKHPCCNGAFWTIKQYEDNEFQLGGNRLAILIGNEDENPITESLLSIINNLQNRAGACFGFDGTKAIVFGEGKLEQEKEFIKVRKRSAAIASRAANGVSGASIAGLFILGSPLAWMWIFGGIPGYFLKKYMDRKIREKILRKEQTKSALIFFLAEDFDKWLGLKKVE